jgi:hypothetical protein
MELSGGHNFFIRPAPVVPLGIGFTFDLHHIIDLTEPAPIAISNTPGKFFTWRYSHWLNVANELWVYAEVARENDSNEIRLFRLKME